jgi:hypothetical protein
MAIIQNMLLSALSSGGRTSRYGDFIIVTMPSAAFATTAQEYTTVQTWARSRASLGNPHRDRSAFVDRFDTVLARSGSGIATKGSRPVLAMIVKGMEKNGLQIGDWSVPHNINESVEVKKKPKPD